jgi:subtilisin family serine protease
LPRFSCQAEEIQAKADWMWLVTSLGLMLRLSFESLGAVSAEFTKDQAAKYAADRRVLFVQKIAQFKPAVSQSNAGWALSALCRHYDNTYDSYMGSDGSGVIVWLLDSGVDIAHVDLDDRVQFSADYTNDGVGNKLPIDGIHGTAVAGAIAGTICGAAKQCNVRSIRVTSDSGGSGEWLIQGLIYVLEYAVLMQFNVVNISLDTSMQTDASDFSTVEDMAISALLTAGIPCIIAAGNQAQDAAIAPLTTDTRAIIVGASDVNNMMASFSNFGPTVDIFAPGVAVPTIAPGNLFVPLDGTSVAVALVTGLVAVYLSALDMLVAPAELKSIMLAAAVLLVKTGRVDTTKNLINSAWSLVPLRVLPIPGPGLYTLPQDVILNYNLSGLLQYTTDGTDPQISETAIQYGGSIVVDHSCLLRISFLSSLDIAYSDITFEYAIDQNFVAGSLIDISCSKLMNVIVPALSVYKDSDRQVLADSPVTLKGNGSAIYNLNKTCSMLVVNNKRCDQYLADNAITFPRPLTILDSVVGLPASSIRLPITNTSIPTFVQLWLSDYAVPMFLTTKQLLDQQFGNVWLSLDGITFHSAIELTSINQSIWIVIVPKIGYQVPITFYDLCLVGISFWNSKSSDSSSMCPVPVISMNTYGTITAKLTVPYSNDIVSLGVEFYEV